MKVKESDIVICFLNWKDGTVVYPITHIDFMMVYTDWDLVQLEPFDGNVILKN